MSGRIVVASCLHHGVEQENPLGTENGLDSPVSNGMEFTLLAIEFPSLVCQHFVDSNLILDDSAGLLDT